MSVNTNVHMVKEEYLAGYEDIYKDVKKSKIVEIEGKPYQYTKTYFLQKDKDNLTRMNDLMQNKKIEYYLWRYYDFFQTILKIDNLRKNLDYEHVCFCFENLPHIESILINNIWRLGEEWSHTIICCESNYQFISSFVAKTNANIRIIKLDTELVFIHEINDYLLNKDFLNKFHGNHLLFSNISSLITSNIEPSDFANNIYYVNSKDANHNMQLLGFSFYKKDKLIEQIAKYNERNSSYVNYSDYHVNKNKYCLEKMPEHIFYSSVLEPCHIDSEYLTKKLLTIGDFSHLSEHVDKEEVFANVIKYLEELLNIYY